LTTLFTLLACATPNPEAVGATDPPSTTGGAPGRAPTTSRTTDVAGLKAAMDAGPVLLVDVRTPGEFAAGHVPGAINVPLDQLSPQAPAFAGHEQDEIWVICEVGGRSANASRQMSGWGLRPVNVDGGTSAWRAAGLPVE
jgi:rhodanese-related sulfurtransferase